MEGAGASDTAHRWTSLVSTCFGWTEVNRGLSRSLMTSVGKAVPSAEEQPDVVLVQYGGNDIVAGVGIGSPDQPKTFRNATWTVLGGIAAALPNADVYVVEPQPTLALRNRGPYDAVLADAAEEFGLGLIRAGLAFPAGYHAADWIHVNDEGHAALAGYVASSIRRLEFWDVPRCAFEADAPASR
jgi:lysophospholipase L1-like esterase